MNWWDIEEVAEQELECWANLLNRAEKCAKSDLDVNAVGAFVIYRNENDAVWYVPGEMPPDGATVVERWKRKGKRWVRI